MKKALIISIAINILLLAVIIWFEHYYSQVPETELVQGATQSNVIKKDIESMSVEDMKIDLSCWYTGEPWNKISQISKNKYRVESGLCERKWKTDFDIRITQKQKKHLILLNAIAGIQYPSLDFSYGGQIGYYRRVGPFYVGGAVSVTHSLGQNYDFRIGPGLVFVF